MKKIIFFISNKKVANLIWAMRIINKGKKCVAFLLFFFNYFLYTFNYQYEKYSLLLFGISAD